MYFIDFESEVKTIKNSDGYIETRLISSLEKVFADEDLKAPEHSSASALMNEVYSFQVACYNHQDKTKMVRVDVKTGSECSISLRKVALIPSELPCYGDCDDNVLRKKPGLYPDLLLPFDKEQFEIPPGQWRSLWVTVNPGPDISAGRLSIEIVFSDQDGKELSKEMFLLEIIGVKLPLQQLIHTQWFHTDCIATWYGTEVFSQKHWDLISRYMKTAADHGINMILTPVFTPPLDTKIGQERPTVQLVDICIENGKYSFDFSRLKRWFAVAMDAGIEYFEISHLFTQWGAYHAPKIMAVEKGVERKIFGWETDAGSSGYTGFLDEFLPALTEFIDDMGLKQKCYFHISDEPSQHNQDSYGRAAVAAKKHLKGFVVMDALSDFSFYEKGLVEKPIPATNHIDEFLEHDVKRLWTYYCCGQYKEVSNRFFNMPSARNRIFGMQLYKFCIEGFLQWGYNFWYSHHSLYPIDPFSVTDAGYAFPSGDAFMVYPGEDGPLESIRLEVFYEALQDLRALMLLEKLVSRKEVIRILEEDIKEPLTFKKYPREASWLIQKREKINRIIAQMFSRADDRHTDWSSCNNIHAID